ncbi:anthranilate synthase component II [Jeotgalibacillus marinus]|uniref:Aminodeoxychorismate/anthranilate synthase component II n=1 Tax=Jeotgalibacillus marinus TaxID=86667 RepID=A0ABV3Q3U7_9BACL
MILLIDNYDSFTYNLYQYLGEIGEVKVVRNDRLTIQEIIELGPSLIVISPGPGHPTDAGICVEVVKELGETIPILGVCLGHQAIGVAFGATVGKATNVMHGKVSSICHTEPQLFGEDDSIDVMRYHSLAIDRNTLPAELEEIATAQDDGEIMAVMHKTQPIIGLQFHPESIGTRDGKAFVKKVVQFLAE